MKGNYKKGNTILIEHLCFNFKPKMTKGSKAYILIFASQESDASQVVYLTFNGEGVWENQEVTESDRAKAMKYATKNLIVEE